MSEANTDRPSAVPREAPATRPTRREEEAQRTTNPPPGTESGDDGARGRSPRAEQSEANADRPSAVPREAPATRPTRREEEAQRTTNPPPGTESGDDGARGRSPRAEQSALENVVVVGASLAGLRACESLRSNGFEGTITLIGAEDHLPYDRPPLSKKILTGDWQPEQIVLRKPESFAELDVAMLLGTPAAALDTAARIVSLADGREVSYDGLIIAVGAACRRLPGQPTFRGIHELRTLDDSLSLRSELNEGTCVVVIGAGFIGLEVASAASRARLSRDRARGCPCTVDPRTRGRDGPGRGQDPRRP